MKIKNLLPVFFVLWLALPLSADAVRAVDSAGSGNGINESTSQATAQSTGNAGVSNRIQNCEKIEARIQSKVENYSQAKLKFTNAFDNLTTRLDRFATNIKSKGYDTTTLEADIIVIKAKITEFRTQADESYALMQQTQTYTCGQAEGQFMSSLKQVRQKVRLTHQQASEIRTFYRDVIRKDLEEIKTQNPGAVSNATTATEDSNTNTETEE